MTYALPGCEFKVQYLYEVRDECNQWNKWTEVLQSKADYSIEWIINL